MADDLQQIIGFKIDGGEEAFRVLEAALAKYNARVEESTQHEVKFNKEGEAVLVKIKGMTSAFEKFTTTLKGTKDGYEEMHTVIKTSKADLERLTGQWQKFFDTLEKGFKKDAAEHEKSMRQQIEDEGVRVRQAEESARRIMASREKLGKLMMAERGDLSWKQLDPSARGSFLRAQTSQFSNAEVERQTQWLQMDLLARNHARIAEQNRRAAQNQVAAIDFNSLQFDTSGKEAALAKMQDRMQQVSLTWQSMLRMVQVHVFYRAISDLVSRMTEGVQTANIFLVKIGEIETIAAKNAATTDKWANEIRKLSDAYGHDLLDVTNSVYEAISNQIAKGTDVVPFMQEAQRLATVGVSSLMDATNALSSIINAYGMSITEASRISAVLFKTVDLGRVKLSEMANELGRLHAVSAQLGVTLEESSAAIATLTIQGIPYAAAQTYLSNVLLKLLRPTETMNKLFKEWGVTSGEAAIKTYGFIGVMDRLEKTAEKNGDVLAEMGEQFGRIRAITGAAGLTGNMDKWKEALYQIQHAAKDTGDAFDIMMDNPGKKMEIEVNKIKNYFVNDWGRSILGTVSNVTGAFGGLANVIEGIVVWGGRIIATYALVKASTVGLTVVTDALTVAERVLNDVRAAGQLGISRFATAVEALQISFKSLATVGVPLLTFAFVTMIDKLLSAEHDALVAAEQLTSKLQKEFARASKHFEEFTERNRLSFDNTFNDAFQNFRQFTSNVRSTNNKLTESLKEDYKQTAKDIERNLGDVVRAFEEQVNESRRKSTEATKESARALENIAKRNQDMAERGFRSSIAGKSDRDQMSAIHDRMNMDLIGGAQALADAQTATDRELAEKRIATAERLYQELTNKSEAMLEQSKNKRQQLEQQLREASERDQSRELNLNAKAHKSRLDRLRLLEGERATQEKIANILRQLNVVRQNEVAAQEMINRLNRERENIVGNINLAEQSYADRKRKEAQDEESKATKQKDQLEVVRNAMREFDALDIKKIGKSQYNSKLDEIQNVIKNTGLSPDRTLELYREIDRQRRTMNKQFLADQLNDYTMSIEKETNRLEEELRKRKKAQDEASGKLFKSAETGLPEVSGELAKIQQILTERDVSYMLTGAGKRTAEQEQRQGAHLQQSPILKKQITDLQQDLEAAASSGDADRIKKAIEKLNEFRRMYDEYLRTAGATIPGTHPNLNTTDTYKAIADAVTKFSQQQADVTATAGEESKIRQELAKLTALRKEMAETIKNTEGITLENANVTVSALEAIRLKAEELKKTYKELQAAQATGIGPPGFIQGLNILPNLNFTMPTFGQQPNFAFGGGTDRGMAFISPGEIVLDRVTSRTFAPVIRAMQSARYMNQGSNVTNVGDINISMSGSGSNETDARHIASLIRREIRRGVIK